MTVTVTVTVTEWCEEEGNMSGVLSVFFVFFLVLCFFVLNTNARGVIAVLQKASKLQQLETRNKHLNEMFYKEGQDPGFDIVIFCEHYVKTILSREVTEF